MTERTARINSSNLRQHIGQNVRLVGEVVSRDDETVTVRASDGGQVTVMASDFTADSKYAEFIGHVQEDGSLKQLTSTPFGDSFDIDNYNELVKLMDNPKVASMFT